MSESRSPAAPTEADRLEAPLFALLDATEALGAALADGAPVETWEALLERREVAFAALERAAAAAGRVGNAVTRSCLERLAALDAAILQAGGEGLVRLRNERIALGGRRRAVLAHGLQPREGPRAITVKA
ncbi:MAG: hypothetical protein R3F21_00365 [Myxococcota bacterium]